ncbi:MAG: choice-of-anchor B family protein [Bacteroidetes bacterium]|nr:choice-of-anchor B family protein [Bacteroidota bacterium]
MRLLLFFTLFALIALPGLCQDQKNILLLDNWTDTTIAGSPGGVRFNEVQGFEFKGKNYAVIGSNNGAHILKIENKSLQFIDFVAGKYQAITAENRDYAVYENYLYAVCDEGNSSLQIMDLSYLPDSVSLVYDSDALFMTAHTLCIDTLHAKMYACGTNSAALKLIDLTNPVNPTLLSDFTAVSYVHDCHVVNDTAFLNCGYDGLRIYDFSGPVPQLLGLLDFYANQGYNHSGYLADSRQQYAFTDETEGTKIKLCYLANFADIKVDQEFGTANFETTIPHELVLLENLLFCAYYNEGLRIYDLAGSPIREIGSYDTYLKDSDFKMNGAWGVSLFENDNLIVVSDRQSGLFLFSFPIKEIEAGTDQGTFVTNTPFIDQNRMLIPRNYLNADKLYFSISTSAGALVYHQQNYLNWVEIPLDLAAGSYIYSIFTDEKTILESGKFVIGN